MWWSNLFVDMNKANFFNFSFLPKYATSFVRGLEYTLLLAVVSVLLAIIPALLLALMRLSKNRIVRSISGAYIALFRSTPLLVQLFLSYYGRPVMLNILNYKFGWEFSVNDIPSMLFVFVTFSLNEAAYMAESIRAAILSVDRKDIEAACWMLSVRLRIRA